MNAEGLSGQGTVLKPIGEIAQLIERTSTADFLLFMIALDKKQKISIKGENPIIGEND
jgi:hypothetical protein